MSKRYRNSFISVEPVSAKNAAQKEYIKAINTKQLIFATGEAGTGKTYIPAAMACRLLVQQKIEKIIITRPAIEAEERLGFLPGTVDEKMEPYIQPFRDVIEEHLGKGHVEGYIKAGRIEIQPLAYMRGRTFKNAWCILDEAQNTTCNQMKMFLTRIGEDAKVIVTGDTTQRDVPASGLEDAVRRLQDLPSVGYINFPEGSSVRSGLCAEILKAYNDTL